MTQIITSNSGGGGGAGAYTYKGSVNTYEDLPSTGLKIGDVYNVINEHTTNPKFPAGANLAWTGTEWDVLGGTFDLSDYQKKLVEGNGIDLDEETNEISVESTVINGAAAGATAVQPGDDVSDLNNDAGYITGIDSSDVTTALGYTPYDSANPSGYITSSAVKDGTLTIQKNGTAVQTFTANQSSNVTANISVPTDTSDLTNGAGFITSSAVKDGTLTIQKNGTTIDTFSANSSSNKTVNITVPTDTSDLTNGAGFVTNQVSDTAYGVGWDGDTTTAPSKNAVYDKIESVEGEISTINGLIPVAATTSNQLADKDFVNNGINSVAAYYITKNAQGDQWATYAELAAASTFYSGGIQITPTRNDYTIVLADENHDNATTRYIYNNGWEYQYTVNETALTQSQLDALNSGITSGKVSTYDGYSSIISGKQDALSLPATPTSGHLVTWGANNKTLADGGAVPTVPTNVSAFTNDSGYITSSSLPGTATSSTAGIVKLGSDTTQSVSAEAVSGTANRTYAIQTNSSDQLVVNVPRTDTTYTSKAAASGGTDISLVTTGEKYTWDNKQDALSTQTAYTSKGTASKVPQITTNTLGQVTGITEVNITYPSQVDDTAYSSSWDGVTGTAPSKNAVYDKLSAMDTAIAGKQAALSTQTAYTSQGTSTKVPTITTNTLGQVTAITETSIDFPVTSVNGQTGAITGLQSQNTPLSLTLNSANWSSHTQTITATGVTASNTVFIAPAHASFIDYCAAQIYCTAQGSDSLTFTCVTDPTSNITVNVVIFD